MTKADQFGENLVLVRGWDFKPSDYQKAWVDGTLLTGQVETSNLCDLLCEYCFREEAEAKAKKRLPEEISVEETCGVIDDLADLEVKAINIIGAGEPTIDLSFLRILEHISSKGVIPVLFTHGARLDEELVEKLYEHGASVIVKVNSFNPTIQDQLVSRLGYTKERDRGLKLLIEAEFNQPGDNYQTRLGIDSVVCQENKSEIPEIFRYCRDNNIMPLMKTFIPAGRTKDRTDLEVSVQEFIEIAKKMWEIDRNEYGITYQKLIPMLGGVPCTQCSRASMYITISGDIYECPGQLSHYGNVRDISIKQVFEKIKSQRNNPNFTCPPRTTYWKK